MLYVLSSTTKKFTHKYYIFFKPVIKKYIYYDIYHVNYDEDKLRKTWYIIFCVRVP